ncbi:hypothetical protein ES703_73253 [subsurface metagenome]
MWVTDYERVGKRPVERAASEYTMADVDLGSVVTLLDLAQETRNGVFIERAKILTKELPIFKDAHWEEGLLEAAHTFGRDAALTHGDYRDINDGIVDVQFFYRHLVACKGPGLVRANDRGASQCLYAVQAFYKGIMSNHPLDSESQRNCHYNWKTLGYGSYGKAHANHYHLKDIPTLEDAKDDDDSADDERQYPELLPQYIQSLLKRSFIILDRVNRFSNLSHLGVHTSSHHDCPAGTTCDVRTGKKHVLHITKRAGIIYGCRILSYRQAFTCQR